MKNSIFVFLFLSSLIISCNVEAPDEVEYLQLNKCPRTNLESNEGVVDAVAELAAELTSVINCGRAFHMPICLEGDPNVDVATVEVEIWCSPFNSCTCNNFPNGFTIADQDVLIDQAITLLEEEMTICGIEKASFEFTSEVLPPVFPCDGFRVQLSVTGTALCCGVAE